MSITSSLYTDMAEQLQVVPPAPQMPSPIAEGQVHRLKRTGARPLKFTGHKLASEMSYVPGTSLWYELAIYKTADNQFVADIRMYTKSDEERDQFRAQKFSAMAELEEFLEHYETANDIDPCTVDLTGSDMPMSCLAVETARLRLRLEEARSQFSGLAGKVLFQLDERNV